MAQPRCRSDARLCEAELAGPTPAATLPRRPALQKSHQRRKSPARLRRQPYIGTTPPPARPDRPETHKPAAAATHRDSAPEPHRHGHPRRRHARGGHPAGPGGRAGPDVRGAPEGRQGLLLAGLGGRAAGQSQGGRRVHQVQGLHRQPRLPRHPGIVRFIVLRNPTRAYPHPLTRTHTATSRTKSKICGERFCGRPRRSSGSGACRW